MSWMRFRRSGWVTSATAPLSCSRSRTGSAPKAEKSGPTIAPAFSAPKRAKYSSGTRSMNRNTRSPLPTPKPSMALANWLLRSRNSAKV